MTYRWIDFFTDPLLRAPTIGSILMCSAASLIGVLVFLRKKSLVGETLSHAAYPGLLLGGFVLALFPKTSSGFSLCLLLGGAFFTSWVAHLFLDKLISRFQVKSDAALCFVLSSFFGVGILLASRMQTAYPIFYRQVQTFLYGQTATMADAYIGIYAILLLLVLGFIVFFYPKLRLIYFDPTFALSIRLRVKFFEKLFSWLLVLAVIAAMKSVGVVLLSGMLIAPALTAKRLTKHLSSMLVLSGVIGGILGFLGAYTSVKLSQNLHPLVFPTGPMIVLMGALLCVITLCFSHTKKRKVNKMWRIGAFLQFLDKMEGDTYLQNIVTYSQKGFFSIWRAAFFAEKKGWVKKIRGEYLLTESGKEVMKSIWGVK